MKQRKKLKLLVVMNAILLMSVFISAIVVAASYQGQLLLESNGKAVSFAILGGTSSEVRKLNNELEQTVLANRVEPENTVIYRDIFQNVDIAYTALANGIKENIILKNLQIKMNIILL